MINSVPLPAFVSFDFLPDPLFLCPRSTFLFTKHTQIPAVMYTKYSFEGGWKTKLSLSEQLSSSRLEFLVWSWHATFPPLLLARHEYLSFFNVALIRSHGSYWTHKLQTLIHLNVLTVNWGQELYNVRWSFGNCAIVRHSL